VLEPYNCFDAEMYADELVLEEPVEFREDQRSKCCALSASREMILTHVQSTSVSGCSDTSLPT
jgi:hypothetical protein